MLQVHLSLEKTVVYIKPTMNCYPRNGQLRDPDFMRHILYHPKQYQYSQHSILWVVLSISAIVLRTRLVREKSQHPIKQVELTIYSKTSLIRNSNNLICKMQKPWHEKPSLKSTEKTDQSHLPQYLIAYGFNQHYNNNITKLHYNYRNRVAIPKNK